MSEPTPTTLDFRIQETQAILDDLAALQTRISTHQTYLNDPILLPAHQREVRDHDVVLANLSLAGTSLSDSARQLAIALRLTRLAAEAKAKSEAEAAAKIVAEEAKALAEAEAAPATLEVL